MKHGFASPGSQVTDDPGQHAAGRRASLGNKSSEPLLAETRLQMRSNVIAVAARKKPSEELLVETREMQLRADAAAVTPGSHEELRRPETRVEARPVSGGKRAPLPARKPANR